MMLAHGVPVARRNLFADRRRAALASAGVAVALLLVLVLDGIFAGAMRQVTAYIERSPADVFVSQADVRTMHMSASALPPDIATGVRAVPGVAWAEPIGYASATMQAARGRQLAYVIGYDPAAGRGGPRELTSGRAPGPGQVVVDRVAAEQLGVRVGDSVRLLGTGFRVSGLSQGGTSIVNTTVYVPRDDLVRIKGPAVSYVLVGALPGVRAADLAQRLQAMLPEVTAQTRRQFAGQEGRIVRDMSADVLQIMTIIGFAIALAVVALTLITVTLAKLREYGVVKALGGIPTRLAMIVVAQAGWTVVAALAVSVALAWLVGLAVPALSATVSIAVTPASIARVGLGALGVGALAALLPLRRVLRVDPASAFRRPA